MNDATKIRTIIANECELEGMADSIVAALAFHGYQIVPSRLEDWRRTQFKPLPTQPGHCPSGCEWPWDLDTCPEHTATNLNSAPPANSAEGDAT